MSKHPVVGQDRRRGRNAPLEWHFYCNSVPFTEATINLETSLGGSESALIFLARGLAARGHRVVIYTMMARDDAGEPWTSQYRSDDGLFWFDHALMDAILRARQPDVFVSLRMPDIMQWPVLRDCKLRVLWNEDLLTNAGMYFGHSWQTDLHAFVSEYHRQQYLRSIPDLEPWTWATVNPVDLALLNKSVAGVEKVPNRLIHVSRPERALIYEDRAPLLEIFTRMRKRNPDLTLGVCRYHSMYENNPLVAEACSRADAAVVQCDGAEWLGELSKVDLYREIAKSQLMVYPGVPTFAETGCIAATESLACGTPMVATEIGALPETLGYEAGRLVTGSCLTDEYQETFVDVCADLLTDPEAYARAVSTGHRHAATYDLHTVAAQWESEVYGLFEDRFTANRRRIFDACLWSDDIRSARVVAASASISGDDSCMHEIDRWLAENIDQPEDYHAHAMAVAEEYETSDRAKMVRHALAPLYTDEERANVKRVLDFAGGNGAMSAVLLAEFPNARVDLVDYSQGLCDGAREWIAGFEDGKHAERFTATCGSIEDVEQGAYDLVFAGEICEHFERPESICRQLEATCRPGGRVLITVPQGPFGSYMHRNSFDWSEHKRGHRFAFEARDIEDMFGAKPGYNMLHMPVALTPRGAPCGHYLVHWNQGGDEIAAPDIERKAQRMRPWQKLAVCMIVKDAENDILRCLKSVDPIADEIWVADTGSTDGTMELAEPYTRNGGGVWSIGTCPDAPPDCPPPGDFGWARNLSVSKTDADWVLWIDADEYLQHPLTVPQFIQTAGPFNGYVLRQCHVTKDNLTADMAAGGRTYAYDKPVRLWRRHPVGKQAGTAYQCYAAIHEHFQAGLNDLIYPALELPDGDIIHTGYMTETKRRRKCQLRNVPLLRYDRAKYPDRELGYLLEAREYCNFGKWELQDRAQAGDPNPRVIQHRLMIQAGLQIIKERFWDQTSLYWDAVWSVYQDALGLLNEGTELPYFKLGEGGKYAPSKARFLTLGHYEDIVRDQVRRMRALQTPPPIQWTDEEPAGTAVVPVVGETAHDPAAVTGVGELHGGSMVPTAEEAPEPVQVPLYTNSNTMSGLGYQVHPGYYVRTPQEWAIAMASEVASLTGV